MAKYFIHVAFEQGAPQRIYGPFDTVMEAQDFGQPFAEEGLDVECRTDVLICDFCSSPEVEWGYPSQDFRIDHPDLAGGVWGSRGGWAACATCHDFIEDNNQAALAMHSVKTFFERNPTLPDNPRTRQMVTKHIVKVHSSFFIASFGQTAVKGAKSDPPLR